MNLVLVVAAVAAVAALLPAAAAAHGRGRPVATDWTVRFTHLPRGVQAAAVDGDRDLRLSVPPSASLTVLGALGEPMLRFDADGVFVDRASPTAQGDGVVRAAGRGWRRLTRAHTYRWHEHRLHALEVVGGGDWAVPLRVDGERTALRGTLRRLHGEPRWPWLAVGVVILAALASVQALRTAGLLGGAAAAAVRIGHAVHVAAVFDAVATAVLAVSLLALLARARTADGRATAALVVGVGAVGEAIVMTPVLTHAAALNALPTALARAFVVSAYAAGAVAVAASFRTLIREESS